MKVPANAAGKTFKCVKCGTHIVVGAPTAPAAPPGETAGNVPPALEPVGQLLVQAGAITTLQLDEALGVQRREGGKTFELLIRLGYLDKARLHEVLAQQPGVAAIELSRVQIDRELAALVPREVALAQLILPIDKLGRLLTVAMACPLDTATISELEQQTGLKVKAMLCRYDDIRTAVTKFYPAEGAEEGTMHTFQLPEGFDRAPKDDLAEKLARLEDLNYAPEALAQLQAVAQNSDTSLADFVDAVSMDPALVAALLRTANSAAYGMPGLVDCLTMALTLLGREGVLALVAQCKKVNTAGPDNLTALRARGAATGLNTAILARASGRAGHELAYTAGLLQAAGSLALAAVAAQRYAKLDTMASAEALAQAEKQALGLDHGEAAQVLLKRWRMPEALQVAAGRYLTPEAANTHAPLAGLIRAAALGDLDTAAEAATVKPDAVARARREEDQQREVLRGARL